MPEITRSGNDVLAGGLPLKQVPLDGVEENIIVLRQPEANMMFPAGFTLVYFMRDAETAKAMASGNYPYKLVPNRGMYMQGAPITDVWKKKADKGQDAILGLVQGISNEQEIYVDKMTVRPGYRRASITSKLVDTLKRKFPNAVVNFSGVTKDGSKFVKGYTGQDWKPAHGERPEF